MPSLSQEVGLLLVIACSTALPVPVVAATAAAAAVQAPARPAATAAAAAPAASTTVATWAPDALEQLLAPVALYPDQLLGQILTASVNSQEVLDAGNWLLQNQGLKGDTLDAAAQKAGFGPAMRALIQFPTVVDMMCQQIDWTRQVGSAFTSDQKAVLAAVQRLRAQAAKVGNLHTTPEQTVQTKTEGSTTIIEVKPTDPQIIYVPQYSPQVVYTTPPPPPPPAESSDTETAVAAGLLGFGVGALLGSALHDDDCCYPNWGVGAVYVGPRAFYPAAYAYRPAYGAGFRPAYGYRSPGNYRYRYNNGVNNAVRGNGNRFTNINVDNGNYFNQFNRNQNLRDSARRGDGSGQSWRGQSQYSGARNSPQSQRLADAAGNTSRRGADVGGAGGRGGAAGVDRGRGNGIGSDRGFDRGYDRSGSNAGAGSGRGLGNRAGSGADQSRSRSGAFSGGTDPGGGRFSRESSARGRSSMGASRGAARGGARGGGRRR